MSKQSATLDEGRQPKKDAIFMGFSQAAPVNPDIFVYLQKHAT
jgi:hypothetical protein